MSIYLSELTRTEFFEELLKFLEEKQAIEVCRLLTEFCLHCFDGDKRCQCWNDE